MSKVTFYVGVTGHRVLPDRHCEETVRARCRNLLLDLLVEKSKLVALSALAEGADSLFAEEALALGIPLVAVIPFHLYEDDFGPAAREHYTELLARAKRKQYLNFEHRLAEAYQGAGRWIVDHADLLIAVWDGRPARGTGGTADIVEYAKRAEKEVVILQVPCA